MEVATDLSNRIHIQEMIPKFEYFSHAQIFPE